MIRILDEITINQIAAGEVIEMAASVVKELIENAIDAKATRITVETKAGGRQRISIKDNGKGMDEEDLLLCVERHATSKISHIDDIYRLQTLGFRGEGLSSIASISKMNIHTASENNPGRKLSITGGKIEAIELAPRAQGTTVEVTSLFYNVPARKKFQKSIAFDTGEIHKILIQAALSHPSLFLEWIHDDKTEFALGGETLLERIEILLGRQFSENLIHSEHGFFGKPSFHRPNRLSQFLFINKRAVTSPFISRAITENYGERLPAGRHPAFILFLQIDPEKIDVNVHPRKLEVKLGCEEELTPFLKHHVKEALEKDFLPAMDIKEELPLPAPIHLPEISYAKSIQKDEPVVVSSVITLLFILEGYFFVKRDKEVLVIDEKRARSRLFYDACFEKENRGAIQPLLLPLTLKKTTSQAAVIEKNLDVLNQMGIAIRPFGKETFCIEAIPAMLDLCEVEECIDSLEEGASQKKMATLFCQKFRKRSFNSEEALGLTQALFQCKEHAFTPEGLPIFFRITPKEIAKWLG